MPPPIDKLVLDAGPLLSMVPLRDLAQKYYTVPDVVAELKDKRAREYFDQLSLMSGVHVETRNADPISLAKGINSNH